MPAINSIFSWDKDVEIWNNLFSKTQYLIKHNHQYSEKIIVSNRYCRISSTKYEGYPFSSFDFNNYRIIIDGIVYNKDMKTIESELSHIASLLDSDSGKVKAEIEDWILNSDGEYNILFYDFKKQNLFLFNDVLGRLPVYYYVNDEIVVLSREINWITPFVNEVVFDKDTLAEYLLFSAPLENRTLVSNVKRLESGTLMKIRGNNKDLSLLRIHIFNLDKKKNAGKSIKENAAELKNVFLDACNNRYQSLKQSNIIVSLSGGLDSRSVAVGLKKIGASFSAVTYSDCEKSTYSADAEIAKIIAEKLQIPWKLFELPKAGIREIEKLLQYKGGLNYVGMSFILNYFEDIKKEYGANISYWTGDEGNASIAGNSPTRRLHNIDELVDYIIDKLGFASIETIEKILDVDGRNLKNKIKNLVQQYPEIDLNNKFLHFLFFQYLYKCQYEGEDTNRVFFWSVAPMYSIPFIEYVLNIPNNQKKYHNLYKDFLKALSPEIAEIGNANWNYPVTSWKRKLEEIKKGCFYNLPPTFRKLILISTKKNIMIKNIRGIDSQLKRYLINIFKTSQTISKNILNPRLEAFLDENITKVEFANLLTICAFINKVEKEVKDTPMTVR